MSHLTSCDKWDIIAAEGEDMHRKHLKNALCSQTTPCAKAGRMESQDSRFRATGAASRHDLLKDAEMAIVTARWDFLGQG